MNNFKLNEGDGPIYKQVYSWIKNKIVNEEWAPGEQIPPETILATDLNVSRHTIRKAMDLLTNEAYLYRQPGKGSFVNKKKSSYPLSYLYSFSEQMEELDKIPSSKIIDIKSNLIPTKKVKERLALSTHERVTRICRLRLADGEPMSLEDVYINSNLAPEIEKKDLKNHSLYNILENDYNLLIKEGDMILGAISAQEEQAQLLKVEKKSPLVFMDCLTYLDNQRPAFLTHASYPYDRYVFSLNLPRKHE